VALRIGIDLDGVLADMDAALARHADELFGPTPSNPEPGPAVEAPGAALPATNDGSATPLEQAPLEIPRRLTERQRRRLWRRIRGVEGFWESLDETEPGAVSRLATLATERRWEIIFLTKRPTTAGATAQVQSQRWLAAKGFHLPSVFVVTGSRGRIAAALGLDVVIDDRPESCIDIATDSTARAIAVWRRRASDSPVFLRATGIDLVHSLDECFDLLLGIDATANKRPGPLERLMRRMGLRRPTAG
jgi:hypothetical protein